MNSSSEEDDFLQESELPRKNDTFEPQKTKSSKPFLLKQLQPEDPHIELGVLLNALSNEASKQKNAPRVFTEEQ